MFKYVVGHESNNIKTPITHNSLTPARIWKEQKQNIPQINSVTRFSLEKLLNSRMIQITYRPQLKSIVTFNIKLMAYSRTAHKKTVTFSPLIT